MKCLAFVLPIALAFSGIITAADITTIKAYVDTDVCSHLLLGPISPERMECSGKAFKQGDEPVLVQLTNNAVFNVNKPKMVKAYVGKLAEATGEVNLPPSPPAIQPANSSTSAPTRPLAGPPCTRRSATSSP